MKSLIPILISSLLAAGLIGCSIDVQQKPVSTPAGQSVLSTATFVPTTSAIGTNTDPAFPPQKQIPITWAILDLTGRLVYVYVEMIENSFGMGIQILDLTSGQVKTIFTAPPYASIFDIAVSPDATQLLLSYTPPPNAESPTRSGIYVMPLDGSAPPQPLILPVLEADENFQAEWSPDGKYIYYTNTNYAAPQQENSISPLYTIFRMAYPGGSPEKIEENSMWPSIAPDSSKIVYVKYTSTSKNKLYVADANGDHPQEVILNGSGIPEIVDAPIFLPDGQSILFSAPVPPQAYQPTWLDKLMGVQIAKAHDVPSDWYVVSVSGGEPVRLTQIQAAYLFASISPDDTWVVSSSGSGTFVMDLDGSNLTSLMIGSAPQGRVRWIP
jgi:Tol biopolymer transport system component